MGVSSTIVMVILIVVGIGAGIVLFTVVVNFAGGANPYGNGEGLVASSFSSNGNVAISNVTVHLQDSSGVNFTITQVYINDQECSYNGSYTSVPPQPLTWCMVVNGSAGNRVEAGQTAVIFANTSGAINPQLPTPLKIICQDNSSIDVNIEPG
jgi:hypothetical protein